MKNSSKVFFRKVSSAALAAALVLGTAAAVPFAVSDGNVGGKLTVDATRVSEYYYIDNGDGTATITGYDGYNPSYISVPAGFGSLTVTAIADGAFEDCSDCIYLSIPNTVKKIGANAFRNCTGLGTVDIPESVEEIGYYAFTGCTGLHTVNVTDNLKKVGVDAFNLTAWYDAQPDGPVYLGKAFYRYKGGSSEMTSYSIANGTKSITGFAFGGCKELVTLTIPDSVESIGQQAFEGCTKLVNVNLPSGLKEIGVGAFNNNPLVTKLNLPEGLVTIGLGAFAGTSVKGLAVPSTWEGNTGSFQGCSSMTSSTISEGVTKIGERAYNGCSQLYRVTIPETVTEIGDYAFNGCTSLKKVLIPETVTTIGDYAFGYVNKYAPAPGVPTSDEKVSGFTIYGVKDSAAHVYAVENGFTFVEYREPECTSTISAASIVLGQSITINHSSVGGYGIKTYFMEVLKPGSTKPTMQYIGYNGPYCTYTPKEVGTYKLTLGTIDEFNKRGTKECTLVVKSNEELVNTSTLAPEKIDLGEATTITLSATGGSGNYKFNVLYKKETDSKWKTFKSGIAAGQISFAPESAGKYDVAVQVSDGESPTKAKAYLKLEVVNTLVNTTVIDPETVEFGSSTTIHCSAEGGKTPYQFAVYYKKVTDTSWATLQNYGENAELIFTPKRFSDYDICVKVKDGNKVIEKKYFVVHVISTLENTSEVSSDDILKGEELTISCSATGGTGPYTYKVLYKKSTDTSWAKPQDYDTNTTVTIKPMKAPLYDVRVIARDKNGITEEKDFQIAVNLNP